MNVTNKVKVCVVGCGYWGKNLARNFFELGNLYAVCDNDPARLNQYTTQYGVKGFSALGEALEDSEVSAVAIATPAEQHAWAAVSALRAGRDVFVEKPSP